MTRYDDADIIRRIESEYGEFPGLALTKPQAGRLFGLEQERCDHILRELVAARVLRLTDCATYVLNRDVR